MDVGLKGTTGPIRNFVSTIYCKTNVRRTFTKSIQTCNKNELFYKCFINTFPINHIKKFRLFDRANTVESASYDHFGVVNESANVNFFDTFLSVSVIPGNNYTFTVVVQSGEMLSEPVMETINSSMFQIVVYSASRKLSLQNKNRYNYSKTLWINRHCTCEP